MKYTFFLDETGDHGLSFIDKNFPLFLLCGCLISEDDLLDIETALNEFKIKYFGSKSVVLHSREIRKCEGAFQVLFDTKLKSQFYNDLNGLLEKANITIIGAGINKEEYIKKYGKDAKDPYSICLSFVIERMTFCLDKKDNDGKAEIIVEKRGKKEDVMLEAHFNSINDRGTFYVTRQRMQKRILGFSFLHKLDNNIGLQLSDLIAYPLARKTLYPEVHYIPFQILEKKIYCNDIGEYKGWGLKIFP
ncbi:MAG: hypothetical protein A2452_00370 [Candidatus Firestonebacteria bacterium RIFOXYC2_FULL_39_67]|nr:MAG: hypothetical protein A2536_03450 [Candidatus Firestonebacteria bacterium RIFOXYD2_FULL_39_29]OGF53730.1 MAG: hypothetical protein A2497_02720 [Candidatus Firestonebacteria bacterium RifOxyC12_full_39_7]OGF54988.1 MAG: hypothetical protein A2452_00370 [Candidatus Firestonebacteria bacterium RIFOXYC2_FULL_39_67]